MTKTTPEKNTKRLQGARARLTKLGKAADSEEVRSARKQVKRLERKLRSHKKAQGHLARRHGSKSEVAG